MALQWRIYYGDGTTFDNLMGSPADAPWANTQIIKQTDPTVGCFLQLGHDCYIYRDRWVGCDILGLYDYLNELGIVEFGSLAHCVKNHREVDMMGLMAYLTDKGLVKLGRTIRSDIYQLTYQKAKNDPDFPNKSAYFQGEPR